MIIVRLKGGLGNQMFEYALGRSLSIKNNVPLGLDLSYLLDKTPKINFTLRDYNLDVFKIEAEIVSQGKIPFIHKIFKGKIGQIINHIKKFLPISGLEKHLNFNKNILDIGPNAYLDGYWQSPKYFENIADTIRQDFTLKDRPTQNIEELKDEIENCNSLCIHIRRGDYVGNKIHDVVKEDYYRRAIEKMKELVKIDKIYVFSDDISWCKENMKFDYPTMFVDNKYGGKEAEGHMYLMSHCRNFIIPNSTFSWWGAWLSSNKNKVVIVPKEWFGIKNVKFDIIPTEWIKV